MNELHNVFHCPSEPRLALVKLERVFADAGGQLTGSQEHVHFVFPSKCF